MFVLKDESILVNEIAPRPHNSGHWTIDACNISQFDALVRSIFDIPIPEIKYLNNCKMINLLGKTLIITKNTLIKKIAQFIFWKKTKLRQIEKMGHVNLIL